MSGREYFKPEEFTCKCGCGKKEIQPKFLEKLNYARHKAGVPFVVTSGVRCLTHNAEIGGDDNSEHVWGEGADIKALDGYARWKIITAAIAAGIRRIGVDKDFIHLGDGLAYKPFPVIWSY